MKTKHIYLNHLTSVQNLPKRRIEINATKITNFILPLVNKCVKVVKHQIFILN